MKILIVEDDKVIANYLKTNLEKHELQVKIVKDFERVIDVFEEYGPHLVLLDVKLPYFNGYYWCSQIRAQSTVPLIFISSMTEQLDQLMAIQMGGDDYITKPIDITLTIAKIQALLRRTYDFKLIEDNDKTFYGISLNANKACLIGPHGSIDLTARELQILTVLFSNGEEYSSREELLDYCWQNGQYFDDNTLAVNISRLRKKLKSIELTDLIHTKKGIGYQLNREGLQ